MHKGAEHSHFWRPPVLSSKLCLRARVAWGAPSMPGGVLLCQEEQPATEPHAEQP